MERATGRASRCSGRQRRLLGWSGGPSGRGPRRRKAEENIQIQAELELVKAHYGERIRRNLDGVAREKATFGSWLKAKEQETQGMAEAVEQVLKAPGPSEAVADPLLSVTVSSATGKPV